MEANVEDLLNELDANELAEAVGLSATADEEVAGLANLSISAESSEPTRPPRKRRRGMLSIVSR